MRRLWRIVAEGKEYIYCDHNGMNKNEVAVLWWTTYKGDLFDRPELKITYVREDENITLPAKKLAALMGRAEFVSLA